MNARFIFLSILVLAAIATAWYIGKQFGGGPTAPTPNEVQDNSMAAVQPTSIHGQGRLQPASGVLKVMATPGERIEELKVSELGAPVKKDQVLAVLQSRQRREIELKLAKAKKFEAEQTVNLEKQLGQFKQESANLAIEEAESVKTTVEAKTQNVELLKNRLTLAQSMLQRLENLKTNPTTKQLVNQTDVDQQSMMVQQIESQLEEVKAELASARDRAVRAKEAAVFNLESVNLAVDKADTQIPYQTIEQTIALAQLAYDSTEIKSPIDGVVLDIIVREGDTVGNQPILLVGDTAKMICVAEINDSQMKYVRDQARVTLASDALTAPLTGKVIEKGVMIGPPSMSDPNPYASVDRRTGKVTIQLDEESSRRARQFVNLQVDIEIAMSKTESPGSTPSSARME